MPITTMLTSPIYDDIPRFCIWVQVTGKERDTESGLDNFGARYYGSNIGRFMSPDWDSDPEAVPYADYENPQSLNLYGYVQNNPLSVTDSEGHCGNSVTSTTSFDGNVIESSSSSDGLV